VGSFKPLIAGKWLTFFTWFFSILAIVSLIWFILYATNSKKKVARTSTVGIVISSLLLSIAIQLILIKNDIDIN
jgi:O-antigen/teichoic acid export membrane protein